MLKKVLENLVFKIIFLLFLRKMKKRYPKINKLSPKTRDVGKGKMVELKPVLPKEGGILTYFPNLKYPFPGFPDTRILCKIAIAKRLIRFSVDWMHDKVKPFVPKNPNLYCRPVREIYRLFNIAIDRDERPDMKNKLTKIRDIICVFAEYDDAYRFIGQDTAAEARLEEFALSDADKWWFLKKRHTFKGKEEFKKKHGGVKLEEN